MFEGFLGTVLGDLGMFCLCGFRKYNAESDELPQNINPVL